MKDKIIPWLKQNIQKKNAKGFLLDLKNKSSEDLLALDYCISTTFSTHYLGKEDLGIGNYIYSETDGNYRIAELANIADENNLLIVSSLTKPELQITRPWNRLGPGADLYPFGAYLKSELSDRFLSIEEYEIEWLYKMNEAGMYKGILDCDDPAKWINWFALTIPQKEIVAKMNQHKKNTQWKVEKFNVFVV